MEEDLEKKHSDKRLANFVLLKSDVVPAKEIQIKTICDFLFEILAPEQPLRDNEGETSK